MSQPPKMRRQLVTGGCKSRDCPTNSPEIESRGRFAVENHNKEKKALLVFLKVLKARGRFGCRTIYDITMEVKDGDKKKAFSASVWGHRVLKSNLVGGDEDIKEAATKKIDESGNEVGDGNDNSSLTKVNPSLEGPLTRAGAKRMKEVSDQQPKKAKKGRALKGKARAFNCEFGK